MKKEIAFIIICLVGIIAVTAFITIFFQENHQATIDRQKQEILLLQEFGQSIIPDNSRMQKFNIAGSNTFIYVVTFDYVFKSAEDANKFINSIVPNFDVSRNQIK